MSLSVSICVAPEITTLPVPVFVQVFTDAVAIGPGVLLFGSSRKSNLQPAFVTSPVPVAPVPLLQSVYTQKPLEESMRSILWPELS